MATGEIEFENSVGFQIGKIVDGYKIAIGIVLNQSRWMNSLLSAGIMQRAYIEASTYAKTREAFGKKIEEYPLVKKLLRSMLAES